MTALALRTSDFANGVSRLHGDVTRQMWEPLLQEREQNGQRPLTTSPTACTCRRGCRSRWRSSSSSTSAPTGATARTTPEFWNRVLEIPDEATLERAHGAQAVPLHVHPPARARSLGAGKRQRRGRRRRRSAARSGRADDRLRAPLHRLQAAGADLQGSRPAHPPAVVAAPARADRLRRQGPSGRRRRQASSAADLSPRDRSRSTADASPSSTTTICTSRISCRRGATSGSTRRASRSKRAARAA